MEILVTAKNLSKSYGVRPLFNDINFVVGAKERIGLIGPNGAGKSTLLQILAQRNTPDAGEVSFRRGLNVGFLTQRPELPADQTVETIVSQAGPELAGEVISKLHLTHLLHQKAGELSGGWQKRVALARELAQGPELLLLDEPTNHLDIESILWLESFLARAEFSTLIVTHDRLFLQRVTNRILELDKRNPQGMLSVQGDYATYLERKEELIKLQERHETVLANKLRRETEWLRRGPKARTTKQQARIDSTHALMAEVDELSTRNQTKSARLDFQGSDKKPKRLIEALGISKRYSDRFLFKDLNLLISPGDRIGLLGNNGSGKSTLIRCLLGIEKPDTGTLFRSEHLKVSYFEQNRETLDPKLTLKQAICPHGDHVNYRGTMVHVNGYLDRFLFRKDQLDVLVGRLSGGEQARVLIARLMLQEANVLVLDEPTNDLDVETLDVLEDCLKEFDGAVLLVSHDRYFLDQVSTEIHAFTYPFSQTEGEVIAFSSLLQWENWFKQASHPKSSTGKANADSKAGQKKKKKLGFNEVRELAGMETTIQKAEAELGKLEAESQSPDAISNAGRLSELYQGMATKQDEIDNLYERWAELEKIKTESES